MAGSMSDNKYIRFAGANFVVARNTTKVKSGELQQPPTAQQQELKS